ncbi:PREDICTED: uncharacterized protein LOC109182561 isoform X2 [Ipomoea nil]|uniref:uncharacterized protein LOC109182561 isoform X2 n=1 Tax=Ipomoea nil TaxID=35883 RepID=UPI000901C973|nr:PREDICTED: uncharacterized protein LOC109182561 isoform X2 [Ipomoea nil]
MESPKHAVAFYAEAAAINVGFYSKADDVSAGAQEWTISGERLFAGMDSVRGFSLFLFLSSEFRAQICCCCGSLRSYLLLLWEYAQIYSFYSIYNGTSDGGIEEVAAELEIGRFVPIFLHHSTLPLTIDEIVSAHQSSFEDDKYSEIKYLFPCNSWKMITENDVTVMISLLKSSKHEHFKKLISPLIKPLLRFLYLPCSSSDFMRNLGSAWLLIGGLCYHLLISYTYLDPTVKYSVKHSQLTEKIACLQLENEVRRECTYLSGSFQLREDDRHTKVLEELNTKLKKLQKHKNIHYCA